MACLEARSDADCYGGVISAMTPCCTLIFRQGILQPVPSIDEAIPPAAAAAAARERDAVGYSQTSRVYTIVLQLTAEVEMLRIRNSTGRYYC